MKEGDSGAPRECGKPHKPLSPPILFTLRQLTMPLVRKNLSCLLPCFTATKTSLSSTSSFSSFHHPLRVLLHFSTSTVQNPSPKPPFIIEYLIASCGLSSDEAIKASRHLTHVRSPSKPDSVLHFLKLTGLSDTHIRDLISQRPVLLCAGVEKTLKPKIRALQELGFSQSELIRVITESPVVLHTSDIRPKIAFWRTFFGTKENLLKALRSGFILSCNLSKTIMPNLSILRECGISDDQIAKLILRSPSSITRSPDTIKALVGRADELGVSRNSGMFWYMFHALSNISRATLDAKINLLKNIGWSEGEVLSAIRKTPFVLKLSEKKIRDTVDFLAKELGYKPSYIAFRPSILLYSLDGRLIPRWYVLRTLKLKGLLKRELGLSPIAALSDKRFVEKYVLPHQEKLPKLHDAYVAACAGRVPI